MQETQLQQFSEKNSNNKIGAKKMKKLWTIFKCITVKNISGCKYYKNTLIPIHKKIVSCALKILQRTIFTTDARTHCAKNAPVHFKYIRSNPPLAVFHILLRQKSYTVVIPPDAHTSCSCITGQLGRLRLLGIVIIITTLLDMSFIINGPWIYYNIIF